MKSITLKSERPASLVGRRVKALAYGGEVLNHWEGDLIIDLASTKAEAPMALLVDHELSKRAGVADRFHLGSGLVLEGYLLKNETGAQVQGELEAGFPWQMSVRVQPGRVEELAQGGGATVNGRRVDGPARVFRDSTILEVSFTALGVDGSTYAVAASTTGANPLLADAKRRGGEDVRLSRHPSPVVQDALGRKQRELALSKRTSR